MDVTGTWHGEYRYEPDAAQSPVTFTLRLTQDGLGRISGTVMDGPGGAPEEGRIIGTCRRGRLQFLKLRPVAYIATAEGGTLELTAYLTEAGYELDRPIEDGQLLYEGSLTGDGQSVSGAWRLDDCLVPSTGGTFLMPGCRGTWSARRADTTA